MDKLIKFCVTIVLTESEILISNASDDDKEDFYTQYPCSCGQEDNNTSCCKTMSALLKKIELDKNLEQLKQQYEYWHAASKHLTTEVTNQIKLDIHRTFPEMFNTQESNSKEYKTTHAKTLQKVLMTIAAYNTTWSYLQGFNFIVGTLILHSTESIAWAVFCALMNNKSISSYLNALILNDDEKTTKIPQRHLKNINNILKKHFPIVYNNFHTDNNYSTHESFFLGFLISFGLNKIKGRKNKIKIIENLFAKGDYFVDCLYIAYMLHAHNNGLALIETATDDYYQKLKKQEHETIISQAEKIFSQVKCCPCC